LSDIARLLVDVARDLGEVPVEAFLLVADVADRLARHLDQAIAADAAGTTHLAGEDDAIGRRQCLDPTARLGIGGKKRIDHGVRNPVADLIGMPLAYRLAREYEIALRHDQSFPCTRRSVSTRSTAELLRAALHVDSRGNCGDLSQARDLVVKRFRQRVFGPAGAAC